MEKGGVADGGLVVGKGIGRGVSKFQQASLALIGGYYKFKNLIRVNLLPDDLASTFTGSTYTSIVLEKDIILYRAGKKGSPLGQFFTFDPPISEVQARIDNAVLPKWPNGNSSPIDTVFKVKIPAGTVIYIGETAYQGGFYIGQTIQIVIEKPWLIKGIEVKDSWPIVK